MRLETEEIIDETVADFTEIVIRSLTQSAYRNYAMADAEALARLGDPMDWAVIDPDAIAFAKQYQKLLIEEGATIINGKKIPWMKKFSAEARAEVGKIIEEGIQQGLFTGGKETKKGTFAKKSTAAKLKEFFNERKSHASTVARTETQQIRQTAKLNRWKARGFELVLVKDGDHANSDDICKFKNGQIWTVEFALNNVSEHPNCVRRFVPVKELTHLSGSTYIHIDGTDVDTDFIGPAICMVEA
jgi:hypothetical protein